MITIKTPEDIGKLKQGGAILAEILRELEKYCKDNYKESGFNTQKIDDKCEELLQKNQVKSSFKNYSPDGKIFFPANICVSVNDEIVHGIPSDRSLREGDLVSLDLGVVYEELYTDAAISFVLGAGKEIDNKLANAARKALYSGIEKAVLGNRIGDIGQAIEKSVLSDGFGVVRDYCGHGVGYKVHEEPSIPNYGISGKGILLEEGMVLAIEPMLVFGKEESFVDNNGWTVHTADGKNASHWEHTVAITADGPLILTI